MKSLEDLRKEAEFARAAVAMKMAEAAEARERCMLEYEIKLAELDETLGVRGRDYEAGSSAKTGDMVVVRAPSEAAWQSVQTKAVESKLTLKDQIEFVYACLAHPGKSELGKMTETTPALFGQAMLALTQLAGV